MNEHTAVILDQVVILGFGFWFWFWVLGFGFLVFWFLVFGFWFVGPFIANPKP